MALPGHADAADAAAAAARAAEARGADEAEAARAFARAMPLWREVGVDVAGMPYFADAHDQEWRPRRRVCLSCGRRFWSADAGTRRCRSCAGPYSGDPLGFRQGEWMQDGGSTGARK